MDSFKTMSAMCFAILTTKWGLDFMKIYRRTYYTQSFRKPHAKEKAPERHVLDTLLVE